MATAILENAQPAVDLVAALLDEQQPMAVADAFGAALAVAERATLWTGDPELLVAYALWRWRDLRDVE
jgi:hypothetical protein